MGWTSASTVPLADPHEEQRTYPSEEHTSYESNHRADVKTPGERLSHEDEAANEEGDRDNQGATTVIVEKLGEREREPKPRDEDEAVPGPIHAESQIQRKETDLPRA